MHFNGEPRKRLIQAIEQAFTNLNDLDELSFQALGKYIRQITTTDDGLPILIRKMVHHAELYNRVLELINEACILRPNDVELGSIKAIYEPLLDEEGRDPYEALLLRGNRALINRKLLRDALRNFNNHAGKPVVIINGPKGSGKTYTKYLLYYLEAATHDFRTVTIDCEYLAAHSINKIIDAESVGQRITAQLRLEDMPKREKEEEVRWVLKFCDWLMIKLRDDPLPHWIILDNVYKVQFSDGAHDLIHSLITHIDENQLNLCLVLLGYPETTRLRPGIIDIIAFEELHYITPGDFYDFFYQLYELRKQSKRYNQRDFTEQDIADSIFNVVARFDQRSQCDKKASGDILMQEINRIFQQPAPPSPMQEMKDRVMDAVQKRLADEIPAEEHSPPKKRYNAYFEAAAVLSIFHSKTLKPVDGRKNSDDLQDVIFESFTLSPTQELDSYTLIPETRHEVLLQLGSREALLHALEANPDRPLNPTQRMFEAYLTGTAPPLNEQDMQLIAATAQVVAWLHDIIEGLPDQGAIQQRQDFYNLIQPFYDLMGPYFRGRESELQKLRNYIDVFSSDSGKRRRSRNVAQSQQALPILIYGVGGIGKSTLIARFIWEYATLPDTRRFPWAYINFDRPGLLAEEPITLLIEAVRQLGIQYPHARVYCDRFCESMQKNLVQRNATLRTRTTSSQDDDMVYGTLSTRKDWIPYIKDFASLLKNLKVETDPFLFVLDTLEEVQYHSYVSVEELCKFLRIFQQYVPRLRVVLSSRVPIADSLEFPTEKIALENFDPVAAQGFLVAHSMPEEVAQTFVGIIGGNPLSLKLVTEVWRLEKTHPHPTSLAAQIPLLRSNEAEIQGMLYSRILGHIHNADVRKLAHPGLVLRRITPDIISKVLAEPCSITLNSIDDAQRLFDEMQREVALVTLENGALRHRSDVRRVMLHLVRAKEPEKVRRIEEAAINYYSCFTDPESRAEEIYHRLSQNQSRTVLETRWQDGTDIEPYLYSALDELSIRSKTWLAAHLNISLTPAEREQAELADWEHDTEKHVRRLLQRNEHDQAIQALKLLHERHERTARSTLYELEAQAFERLQEWEQALNVLKEGINKVMTDHMLSIDLRLHSARLYIRQQEVTLAQSCLNEAAMLISLFGPETIRELDLILLRLELQRVIGRDTDIQEQESSLQASLRNLFTQITDEQITQYPTLMARFACTIGEVYPECLLPIIRNNRLFSRRHLPLRHLCRALVDWDFDISRERRERPGVLARWVELPEQPTLLETWEQTILPSTPETLTTIIVQLLEAFPVPLLVVRTNIVALLCEQVQDLIAPQILKRPGGNIEELAVTTVELPASLAPDVEVEAKSLDIQITNQQREALSNALLSAFPTRERLEQMLRFRLDRRLDTIALSEDLRATVYQLLQAAEAEGWLTDLVAAAIESNPHNGLLRQMADQFDLVSDTAPTLLQTARAIEAQFETKSILNPTQFSARLGELEAQVGRVEFVGDYRPLAMSTGFLIGPNIFMTSYHNFERLQQGNIQQKNVLMRFDYKESSDGRSITSGTLYQLAEKDWLIDYDEQLDYALLRVSGTPGLDPIGGERAELDAPARGWITIPQTPPVLFPGTSIIILHYPEGGPLKMSLDTDGIVNISADGAHIQYRHNTAPGSTGAPCFNSNWELIAIHHKRTGFSSNSYGEGTTMTALVPLLKTRGILDMQQTAARSAESQESYLLDELEARIPRQQENDNASLEKQQSYIRSAYSSVQQAYSLIKDSNNITPSKITYAVNLLENASQSLFQTDELGSTFNSLLPSRAIQQQIKRTSDLCRQLSLSFREYKTRDQIKSLRSEHRQLLDQLQELERLLEL